MTAKFGLKKLETYALSYDVDISTAVLVLSQSTRLTDGQTDRMSTARARLNTNSIALKRDASSRSGIGKEAEERSGLLCLSSTTCCPTLLQQMDDDFAYRPIALTITITPS